MTEATGKILDDTYYYYLFDCDYYDRGDREGYTNTDSPAMISRSTSVARWLLAYEQCQGSRDMK